MLPGNAGGRGGSTTTKKPTTKPKTLGKPYVQNHQMTAEPAKKSSSGGGGHKSSARSRYAASKSTRSSGGGGGSSSRSSSRSSTPKPAPAPKPVVPGVGQYLQGDTTYQDQIAQLRKAYADYVASQNNERNNFQSQYGLNVKNLGNDKTQAFSGLQDDFASRGLLQSGVYGKAYSDLQTDYNQRQAQLDTERSGFLGDLTTNLANFKGDQATTTTSAKQEAIARRAAKYSLRS